MDIDAIASLSTALSMARVRNEVGIRVLKMAQGQGQVAADLIAAAAETALQIANRVADDAGTTLDVTA